MKRLITTLLLAIASPAVADETVVSMHFEGGRLELSSKDLPSVEVAFARGTGEPVITFRISDAKASEFTELTRIAVGYPLHISICGQVQSSPVVREMLHGASGQITGKFTLEEAEAMVRKIKAGSCN